jgi:hypothetical protein
MYTQFWWESQAGKRPLEVSDVGGRITLKWIVEKQDGVVLTGLIWFRKGPVVRSSEQRNEPWVPKNVGKLLSN